MADDRAEAAPRPCTPCRETGKVVSNLGGSPSTVICPWCGGDGVIEPGRDAQEHAPPVASPS